MLLLKANRQEFSMACNLNDLKNDVNYPLSKIPQHETSFITIDPQQNFTAIFHGPLTYEDGAQIRT